MLEIWVADPEGEHFLLFNNWFSEEYDLLKPKSEYIEHPPEPDVERFIIKAFPPNRASKVRLATQVND